jgi:hypothetical protein
LSEIEHGGVTKKNSPADVMTPELRDLSAPGIALPLLFHSFRKLSRKYEKKKRNDAPIAITGSFLSFGTLKRAIALSS